MTTCKSPKSVLLMAYGVGLLVYKEYSSPCSRKRFMLPQLFACLVLREFLKMSYRGIEALLRDCTELRAAIDMMHTPDHATLHRAFVLLMNRHNLDQLLGRTIMLAEYGRLLGNTVAIDSTLMEIRHRSRHYEQRRRHYAKRGKTSADTKRSRTAKRVPKLTIGVNTRSHLIMACRPRTGMGSDAPDFLPLLEDILARYPRIRHVLADAGYDSHRNHQIARERWKVQSLIKAGIGRPSSKPPVSTYRRRMKKQLFGSQAGRRYGQRAQVETVNSMMKRNLGDSLRARTPVRRRYEILLRSVVHNVMLLAAIE